MYPSARDDAQIGEGIIMSTVCDFNIHIPKNPVFQDDLHLHQRDLTAYLDSLILELSRCGVHSGNVMVLDANMDNENQHNAIRQSLGDSFCRTAILDPRVEDVFEWIERLASLGYRGVKIHPYFQNLADHDFYAAIGACQYAASKGFWLALCCSYGTTRVYANHAVKLLGALVQAKVDMPIIALHSGGRLALEVMSIALEAPNVYLETSFSIPFWLGSSVEQDIAFAIRKVGVERCIFGSDRPYQPLQEAIEETLAFFQRFDFRDADVEAIMQSNFLALKERTL